MRSVLFLIFLLSGMVSLCTAFVCAPRERLGGRGGHPLGGFHARIEFPEALCVAFGFCVSVWRASGSAARSAYPYPFRFSIFRKTLPKIIQKYLTSKNHIRRRRTKLTLVVLKKVGNGSKAFGVSFEKYEITGENSKVCSFKKINKP